MVTRKSLPSLFYYFNSGIAAVTKIILGSCKWGRKWACRVIAKNSCEISFFVEKCNLLLVSHFCGLASYLITVWAQALKILISLLPGNKPWWHHATLLLDIFYFLLLFSLTFRCWHSSRNTVISASLLFPLFSFGSVHKFQKSRKNQSALSSFPKQSSIW